MYVPSKNSNKLPWLISKGMHIKNICIINMGMQKAYDFIMIGPVRSDHGIQKQDFLS